MLKPNFPNTLLVLLLTLLILSCSDDDNPANPGQEGFIPDGMVLIQAKDKSFRMGSDIEEFFDEQPVHTVSFTRNFWMDTTEVTQSDYDALMSEAYSPDYATPSWHEPFGVGANYPAYEVYWGDAALYCNARSNRDGLDTVYTYTSIIGTPGSLCELEGVEINYSKNGYRLPTEAEWEYACRAGAESDFYWGKSYDSYPSTPADTAEINSYAVWYGNSWQYGSDDEDHYGTHPVASKQPNAYGLYDMAGNLYEWCNDWWGDYSSEPAVDPTGPESSDWRRMRGGSWGSYASCMRSANRTFDIPGYAYYYIGFRVVLP